MLYRLLSIHHPSTVIHHPATKGFWTQMLGIGDFYYELAVQIVDICFCTRADNGGLMGMVDDG